jgi:hypothetical protein
MSELPNYSTMFDDSKKNIPTLSPEQEQKLRKGINEFLKKADEQGLEHTTNEGVRKYSQKRHVEEGNIDEEIYLPEKETSITKENTSWQLHTKEHFNPNEKYDFYINTGDGYTQPDIYLKIVNGFLEEDNNTTETKTITENI